MESKIRLISNDNGFLFDQLKTEGVTCVSDKILPKEEIEDGDLVIVNSLGLHRKESVFLKSHCCRGNIVINIKPDENFDAEFGLTKNGRLGRGYLYNHSADGFENAIYQIFNIDKYSSASSIAQLLDENRYDTGYPAIFKKEIGVGALIVIAFDLCYTIFTLNEGQDIVSDLDGDGVLRVDDGRSVENSENLIPQADLIRRLIVTLIEENAKFPLPRIWYFPHKKVSAICFTHDSDGATVGQIDEVSKIDIENGIKSTTFMRLLDGSVESWHRFKKVGLDLQLHVVYLYHPALPSYLRQIQSLLLRSRLVLNMQRLSLHIQKLLFDSLMKAPTVGVRNHGLVWNKLTDQPVWMSQYGVQFDSTLGANRDYGYVYGTGLPYFLRHPITYRNLNVLEFPLHIMDSALVSKYESGPTDEKHLKVIHQFLDEAVRYNSLVVVNFHHYYLSPESGGADSSSWYLNTISYAKSKDFFVESMAFFNDFWRKRLQVDIQYISWDDQVLRYRVCSPSKVKGITQVIPRYYHGLQVEEVLACGQRQAVTPISLNGKECVLIEMDLPDAETPVEVIYRVET